jgi:Predicted molecular chaperone distantly related to HSP70-fold metalloproteases
MKESYYSLGLMSGTSMDGVDASIIKTDGKTRYSAILDKYYEYPTLIYNNLLKLRAKIKNSKDLKKYDKQIKLAEKK